MWILTTVPLKKVQIKIKVRMKSYVIAMGMFHINSGSILSLHVILVRSCCGIYGFATPLHCCLFPSNLSVFLCLCVCVCVRAFTKIRLKRVCIWVSSCCSIMNTAWCCRWNSLVCSMRANAGVGSLSWSIDPSLSDNTFPAGRKAWSVCLGGQRRRWR